MVIAWALESEAERVHRLRRSGWSQQRIAGHLGITRYRCRKILAVS